MTRISGNSDASVTRTARRLYQRWVRSRIRSPLVRQRLKLLWFVWGYRHLFLARSLTPVDRLRLIGQFLRIDWYVQHAHTPEEISFVCLAILERPAQPHEVVVEAGCWFGGSSAKFSLVCQRLGYTLRVYDSFAGVEPMTKEQIGGGFDFSGTYVAPEETVRTNVSRFGAMDVCSFHRGWFSETLAVHPIGRPVRVGYIDCDVAKGTREALAGILPTLVPGGRVFSQDFHIEPVQRTIDDPQTWASHGRSRPTVERFTSRLAALSFD